MEKYDAAFSATENELIYEARLIPPDMERIEALLRQGADCWSYFSATGWMYG